MKKISVLFVAVLLTLGLGMAKAQKLASMDYESVLAAMPEAKKLTTDLETFSKAKGDELNKQAASFQTEVEQYQKTGASLTEAQRKTKEDELQK